MVTDDQGGYSAKKSVSASHSETFRLVFRTPLWHRLVGVSGFLLATVAAFAAAIDFPGLVRPLGIAIGIALCVLAWRFWRLRIEADDEGIRVVDWRRTTRIPWESIQRFSWDLGLAVRMRDGTHLIPDVFSPMNLPITGQLDYLKRTAGERLQAELRRQRHRV